MTSRLGYSCTVSSSAVDLMYIVQTWMFPLVAISPPPSLEVSVTSHVSGVPLPLPKIKNKKALALESSQPAQSARRARKDKKRYLYTYMSCDLSGPSAIATP